MASTVVIHILLPYLPPNTHQLIHTECPHSVPLKPTMQATLQDSDLIQVRRQRKKNKTKRNHAEVLIQTGADNGDRLKPCIRNLTGSSLAFQTWMWFPFFQFSHWVLQSGLHPSVSGVVRIYSCWSLALIIHKEQNSSGPLLSLDHLSEVERWKHASCQWNKSRTLWDTVDTLTWKCSHLSSMLWAKTKAGQALWRSPGSSRLVTKNTTSP